MRLKQELSSQCEEHRVTDEYADLLDSLREELPDCAHEKIADFILLRLVVYAEENGDEPLTDGFIREMYEDAVERWPELSELLDEEGPDQVSSDWRKEGSDG